MTTRPKCCHPGCERLVAPDNTSGVCLMHLHSSKCRCAKCMKSAHHDAPREDRPGIRSVLVPQIPTTSGSSSYVRISLPKEPWEVTQ